MAKIKYGERTLAEITTGQSMVLHLEGQELEHDIEIEGFASAEGGAGGGDSVDYLAQRLNGTLTEYSSDEVTGNLPQYIFKGSTALTSINLPNAAGAVERSAFEGCTNLTTVNLPNINSVEDYTFVNCVLMDEINIPKITAVGTSAFQRCLILRLLDLHNVININPNAFSITAIEVLILRAESLCTLANISAFNSTPIAKGTGYIYVPRDLVDSYKVATNWSTYADQIRAIEDYPEITGG